MDSMLTLARAFAEHHADAAADALDGLPPDEVGALLAEMPADSAAGLLVHLRAAQASECLRLMPPEQVIASIRRLAPQPAAELLRQLDATTRGQILAATPRPRRIQIELILRQPRQTVGAWMDTRIDTVRPATTAGDALRRLARHEEDANAWTFVIGPRRRLVGAVRLGDLMRADPEAHIELLLHRGPPPVRTNVTIHAAIGHAGWHEHDLLPVIDAHDRLVGVIAHVRLRQALAAMAHTQVRGEKPATLMDIANIWYLGMAEIMNATIARSPDQPGSGRPDGAP